MNIGVDIRSLLTMRRGGVPHYTLAILTELIRQHPEDRWHLLQTGRQVFVLPPELDLPGVRLRHVRWPNKVANTVIAAGYPLITRQLGPDIDVFFAPNLGFISLPRSVPLVLTVHDLSYALYPGLYPPRHRLWHHLVRPRRLAGQAAQLIAVSQQTADELHRLYGVPADRISVVHSGIDDSYRRPVRATEQRRVTEKYRLPTAYYLYLGALEMRKNVTGMLQAFSAARQEGLGAELLLAGSGRVAGGLPDGVRHLGFVDEADKPALYRAATGCLLVSRHEGFGFPPLEALAVGTPSIVSDLPVFRELLGDAALRVPVADAGALTKNLVHLERETEFRQELVTRGAAVVNRFTWEKAAAQTYRIISQAARHAK